MRNQLKTRQRSSGFRKLDFEKFTLSDELQAIRKVLELSHPEYSGVDVVATLKFYTQNYVRGLARFTSVTRDTVILDAGAGFGWLSIALALSTEARIIAMDTDVSRLDAGWQIAKILGLEGRIDWRFGRLGKLPLENEEADMVLCLDVLEDVHGDGEILADLRRVAGGVMLITTPNLWYPLLERGPGLPLYHWLPASLRRMYAGLMNRDTGVGENQNLFWSPRSLQERMGGFEGVPFAPAAEYDSGERAEWAKLYSRLMSKLGVRSEYLRPFLSYIFRRKGA